MENLENTETQAVVEPTMTDEIMMVVRVEKGRTLVLGYEKPARRVAKSSSHSIFTSENQAKEAKNRYYHVSFWDLSISDSLSNTATNFHYIYAEYANGMCEDSKFIITQGTMFKTDNDFFDMVWQNNCGIVVVLTKFCKNEKDRYCPYWPTNVDGPWVTEEYTVSTKIVKRRNNFTKYFLELKNSKVLQENRNVSLYHYTDWPSDGDPVKTLGFNKMIAAISLEKKVLHRFVENLFGPIIVHGCAGIGRKGASCMIQSYVHICSNETNGCS
ncbi:GfV-B46-ORF1 [Ichnoviriform fumiferanae]|uniref:GfV-B46-ORF1 n=1 Tax=Ichnoviriform fumiferanae TaxID=419435 RepID=A2PZU2_9VIRU|nr:GfV-B46-ORF1 [Ichnoviriform fumiferanae]BAF45514.1 GfV-B46-ORF1 [Ichnoviriform fumiferanae]